jgi:hypothetical protein
MCVWRVLFTLQRAVLRSPRWTGTREVLYATLSAGTRRRTPHATLLARPRNQVLSYFLLYIFYDVLYGISMYHINTKIIHDDIFAKNRKNHDFSETKISLDDIFVMIKRP